MTEDVSEIIVHETEKEKNTYISNWEIYNTRCDFLLGYLGTLPTVLTPAMEKGL